MILKGSSVALNTHHILLFGSGLFLVGCLMIATSVLGLVYIQG